MTEHDGPAPGAGGAGVEQELLGLLAALRAALGGYAATHPGPAASAANGSHGAADLPTTCGVCPICLGIATLSRGRPELLRHLSDAATSMTAALACLTTPPGAPTGPGTEPAGSERPARDAAGAPSATPATQVIDIDD